jgi:membrane protease YdiL (CAAX protease family)
MLPLAVIAPSESRINWLTVVTWAFTFYISASFVCVTLYTLREARAGRLLKGPNSPAEFVVPPWLWQGLVLGMFSIFFFPPFFFLVVPMLAVMVASEWAGREQIGTGRFSASRLAAWSILLCGALVFVEIPLANWSNSFFTMLLKLFNFSNPEQSTVEEFKSFHRVTDILLFLVQAVVLSPILEEIFFRGLLFTFLKNHTSILVAAVLSAGVFAFAHVNIGSVIPLWFLGVALALAYQHTGSLLLPICVHGLFNLMTALSLLLNKGSS